MGWGGGRRDPKCQASSWANAVLERVEDREGVQIPKETHCEPSLNLSQCKPAGPLEQDQEPSCTTARALPGFGEEVGSLRTGRK